MTRPAPLLDPSRLCRTCGERICGCDEPGEDETPEDQSEGERAPGEYAVYLDGRSREGKRYKRKDAKR